MSGVFCELQKEDITIIPKKKTNHGHNYGFFDDTRKQLESFSLNFRVAINFYPCPLQRKTLANSFRGSQWGCSFDGWRLTFADFDG